MCRDLSDFVEVKASKKGILNLASSAHTSIETRLSRIASLVTNVDGAEKSIQLNDALHVPDLRTNLNDIGRKNYRQRFQRHF